MTTSVAPKAYKNFVNGEWLESRSGKAFENRNPADTNDLIGLFAESTEEDVNLAVQAAKDAYRTWRLVPAPPPRGNSLSRRGSFWCGAKMILRAT